MYQVLEQSLKLCKLVRFNSDGWLVFLLSAESKLRSVFSAKNLFGGYIEEYSSLLDLHSSNQPRSEVKVSI